jgi:hypothetical protein
MFAIKVKANPSGFCTLILNLLRRQKERSSIEENVKGSEGAVQHSE